MKDLTKLLIADMKPSFGVTEPGAIAAARSLISRGAVTAEMTGIDSEIFSRVRVQTQKAVSEPDAAMQIHCVSFQEILHYVRTVPLEEIQFLRDAFPMNLTLLEKGLQDDRTVIAQYLLQKNGNLLISKDALCSAQLLCAGAIEVRVLGIGEPAMRITGSGSHEIIAVMPLYAAAKSVGLSMKSSCAHLLCVCF